MSDTETKVKIKVDVEMDDAVKEFERLQKAQAQAAAQTKLVGDKFSELGKSMVGLQMHDAFNKISKAAGEATGGVLDLNGAFAGYQVAGVWGAAIGGLSGVLSKLGDSLGLSAGLLDMTNQALSDYEKGITKASNPVRQFLDDQHKLANQYRVELFDAFKVGVKAAKDYEDSMKDVIATSKTLVSNIERIKSAINGPSKFDRQIDALSSQRTDREKRFADFAGGGLAGGVTGKVVKPGKPKDWFDDSELKKLEDDLVDRISREIEAQNNQNSENATGDMARTSALSAAGTYGSLGNLNSLNRGSNDKQNAKNYAAYNTGKDASFMESTFGKVDEIDLYKSAFDGLTGAVTAGYDAMVDGTMSFGAAFKKSIADALKALGGQMLVEALKETAYGIASLARYDYGGAALHFKSAAGFGIGAVAAGAVASGLGGGGGGGSAHGAGAGGGVGGGGGGGGGGSDDAAAIRAAAAANDASALAKLGVYTKVSGGQGYQAPIVIIQTNPFRTGDTPRMKRNEVDQFTAMGSGGRTAVR